MYADLDKNDKKAMPIVKLYIAKAKRENKDRKLIQGYRDGLTFSVDPNDKLKYADSAIAVALKNKNRDTISDSYLGKGSVYYFNFKKYKPALTEYLKAYDYASGSKDEYLKHKILYHLGVVKSFLGYYDESLDHFNNCIRYFRKKSHSEKDPNLQYNYTKGYLNSLHQIAVCYLSLNDLKKADSIINIGIGYTRETKNFSLEHAYFQKSKGIVDFNNKNYNDAIYFLKKSLPQIENRDDFGTVSVIHFYLGQIYLTNKDEKTALYNFNKIDSIFNKNKYILPEVRQCFEILIDLYRSKKDPQKELYYTKQFIRSDSIINKDFTYLSSKIHKDYDKKSLLEKRKQLEQYHFYTVLILGLVILIGLIVSGLRVQKEKQLKTKYSLLMEKIEQEKEPRINQSVAESDTIKIKSSILTEELVIELKEKLIIFEDKKLYFQKNMTIKKMETLLKTNTHYLSTYINEYKEVNFNRYLAVLRINYITSLLNSNGKEINYTIDALALECGIASRQNFSDLFFEINSLRPKDFIKLKKQESKSNNM